MAFGGMFTFFFIIGTVLLAGVFQFFSTARGRKKWISVLPSLVGVAGIVLSVAGIIIGRLTKRWEIWLFCFVFWVVYYIGIGIGLWYGKKEKRVLSQWEGVSTKQKVTPPFEKECNRMR